MPVRHGAKLAQDGLIVEAKKVEQRFFSLRSAAVYTDLSVDSLRRMVESGRLPGYRPRPGKILLDRRELDAVILAATTRPIGGRGSHLHGAGNGGGGNGE